MSTTLFRRPPRQSPPEMPSGELSLQEPPVLPEAPTGNLGMLLMYLPMAVGSSVTILIFVSPSKPGLGLLAAGLMALTSMTMVFGQVGRTTSERKRRMRGERRDYLRYLAQTRKKVRAVAAEQRASLAWRHPDPAGLWSVAMSSRLWERRPTHPDFAEVRIGTGPQRLAMTMTPMQTKPVEDLEPLCARALRRFIRAYTTVTDLPAAVFLRGFAQVQIRGDEEAGRELIRAMLAQLVTLPLPGRAADRGLRGGRARRRVGLGEVAAARPAQRRTGRRGPGAAARGRHRRPGRPARRRDGGARPVRGRRDADAGRAVRRRDRGRRRRAAGVAARGHRLPQLDRAERLDGPADGAGPRRRSGWRSPTRRWRWSASTAAAARSARRSAGRTGLERAQGDRAGPHHVPVPARRHRGRRRADGHRLRPGTLLGVGDLDALDPSRVWPQAPTAPDRLRVPIGIAEDGSRVELDIKESAQGGMGPHGLLIGATGSGKSELLRTLVLALAITHSSEMLNFVLVDFKGGATFLGLDGLPHTSAVITNLADEAPLVTVCRTRCRAR